MLKCKSYKQWKKFALNIISETKNESICNIKKHLSLLGSDLKEKIDDFKDDFNFESLKEALNKKTWTLSEGEPEP